MEWSGLDLRIHCCCHAGPWHCACFLSRMQYLLQWVMQSVHPSAGLSPGRDSQELLFFEPHPLTPLQRHTWHVMLCWQTVLLFTVMVWYFFRSPAIVAVDQVPWSPLMSVSQCNFHGTSLDVVSWGFLVILILIYWNLWYWMLHNKTQSQLDVRMRKSWNLFYRIELFNALPKPAYCVS